MSSVLPIGPFHLALKEAAYFKLEVEGEKIVGGDFKFGYMHRGIEASGDKEILPQQHLPSRESMRNLQHRPFYLLHSNS